MTRRKEERRGDRIKRTSEKEREREAKKERRGGGVGECGLEVGRGLKIWCYHLIS